MASQVQNHRWAVQYYLGRPLARGECRGGARGGGEVRAEVFDSEERRARGHSPYRGDEFTVWRDGAPTVVVLSSCQGAALARAIAALAEVSVFGCAVTKTKDPETAQHLLALMEHADHILIAPFTHVWGDFSQDNLRARFGDRVVSYNRPFFEALHPDLTYVHGSAPKSPVGSYHSRITIDSYLAGLSIAECLERFSREGYEEIGFPEVARKAFEKLETKDKAVEIKVKDLIEENIKKEPLFYTINHPTSNFFTLVAERFLELAGIKYHRLCPSLVPSVLITNTIWPVDRIWSGYLGLNYNTNNVYWYNFYMYSLEEFVWRSYRIYEGADPNYLRVGLENLKSLRSRP